MKRIQVLSDLHVDLNERNFGNSMEWPKEHPMADVVVIAGDIAEASWSFRYLEEWMKECFPTKPVIYVPGNHDYYGGSRIISESILETVARRVPNLHVLVNESLLLEDMWFLGTPLWCDFRQPLSPMERARFINGIGDFHHVRKDPGLAERQDTKPKPVRPEDYVFWHNDALEWLEQEKLIVGSLRPTIVVTHWAPHLRSSAQRFAGSWMNPFFVNDIDHKYFEGVHTWIHGHTHDKFRYNLGDTRVICNPHGYLYHGEGADFDPHLLIEVE